MDSNAGGPPQLESSEGEDRTPHEVNKEARAGDVNTDWHDMPPVQSPSAKHTLHSRAHTARHDAYTGNNSADPRTHIRRPHSAGGESRRARTPTHLNSESHMPPVHAMATNGTADEGHCASVICTAVLEGASTANWA